jgi:hypothetical protein
MSAKSGCARKTIRAQSRIAALAGRLGVRHRIVAQRIDNIRFRRSHCVPDPTDLVRLVCYLKIGRAHV